MIKLTKEFNAASDGLAADFPALALYWHADDISPDGSLDAVSWVDRILGNTLTITPIGTDGIHKDSSGIYAADSCTISASGDMPEITTSHYAVCVSIGKTSTASTVTGALAVFGADGATNPVVGSGGIAKYNSASLNSAPTLNPAALTNVNKYSCLCSLFDYTDATSPRIERVVSNTDFEAAASTTYNTAATTTTSTNAITPGQMAAGMTITGLTGATPGARQQIHALFLFTTPVSFDELKIACIEMARTRQLYAGWRGKL